MLDGEPRQSSGEPPLAALERLLCLYRVLFVEQGRWIWPTSMPQILDRVVLPSKRRHAISGASWQLSWWPESRVWRRRDDVIPRPSRAGVDSPCWYVQIVLGILLPGPRWGPSCHVPTREEGLWREITLSGDLTDLCDLWLFNGTAVWWLLRRSVL